MHHLQERHGDEHSAEVDYFMVNDDTPSSVCRALSGGPFGAFEPALTTHALLGVEVTLSALHPRPPRRPAKRVGIGAYDDPRWMEAARAIETALVAAGAPSVVPSDQADVLALRQLWADTVVKPAMAVFETAPAAARAPGSHPLHRLFHGLPLPPPLVAEADRLRRLRRQVGRSPPGSAARAGLMEELRSATRTQRQRTHRYEQMATSTVAARLSHMLGRHSHMGHKALALLRPGDPLVAPGEAPLPQLPGQPPPTVLFHTHFSDLAHETRLTIPALAYLDAFADLPRLPPSVTAHLAAPSTAEEVELALFPVPAYRLRDHAACLPGCLLCAGLRAHAQAHCRTPSEVSPPEPRPRLHTSTAAGDDGVRPETLRWPRLPDSAATDSLRKQCCQLAAAWMSAALSTSTPPAGGRWR